MTTTETTNFKPVLFSTPMVQAIMAGRKTQTRRVLKKIPRLSDNINWAGDYLKHNTNTRYHYSPYGVPGDVLWVRETWSEPILFDGFEEDYYYKADNIQRYDIRSRHMGNEWKPSIHMPKDACRIFLKVVDVRVEKLQDINEFDAKAEGVDHVIDKITGYCGYDYINGGYNLMTTPYHGFRSLWKKINGEQSWAKNPWVWVIEFEQIEKPRNFK